MIVANDAEATIGSTESAAHLLFATGDPVTLPRLPKEAVASEIVRHVARLATGGH
jgi:hypothetical protein